MKSWQCAALAALSFIGTGAVGRRPLPTAIFPFSLDDTSLQGQMQGPRPDEHARLASLDTELRDMLRNSGCCTVLEVRPRAGSMNMENCDGCEADLARQAGAKLSVTGWVQKVSNLILNINVVVRDVATNKIIHAGSVDIRGNTDESWSRGLSYLLSDRLHPSEW
jgi:hypothetical protein